MDTNHSSEKIQTQIFFFIHLLCIAYGHIPGTSGRLSNSDLLQSKPSGLINSIFHVPQGTGANV